MPLSQEEIDELNQKDYERNFESEDESENEIDDEQGEREYMKAQLRNGQKLSEDDMMNYFGIIEY